MPLMNDLIETVLELLSQPEAHAEYIGSGSRNNLEQSVKIRMSERAGEFILKTILTASYLRRFEQTMQNQYKFFCESFQSKDKKSDDAELRRLFLQETAEPIAEYIRAMMKTYLQNLTPLTALNNNLNIFENMTAHSFSAAKRKRKSSVMRNIYLGLAFTTLAVAGYAAALEEEPISEQSFMDLFQMSVAGLMTSIVTPIMYGLYQSVRDTPSGRDTRSSIYDTLSYNFYAQQPHAHELRQTPELGDRSRAILFTDILNAQEIFRLLADVDPMLERDVIVTIAEFLYTPNISKLMARRVDFVLNALAQQYAIGQKNDHDDQGSDDVASALSVNEQRQLNQVSGGGNVIETEIDVDLNENT